MNTAGDFRSREIEPNPIGRLHSCQSESVGVMQVAGESRVVAIRRITTGERLGQIEGKTTDRPTRYSVQIDEHLHMDIGSGHSAPEILGRHYWRFLNHGCEPSAAIEGRVVIAQRDIEPGETVTYNYNTTEWDIAEPFNCHCGSVSCLKVIRGFKYLTAAQREQLPGHAPHLGRLAQRERRIAVAAPV